MIVWRNVRRYRMLLIRRVVPQLMCVPAHVCVCVCVFVHVTNVFGSQFLFGNVACVLLLLLFPLCPARVFLSSQSPFVTRQFPRYFSSYIISPTDTQIYNLTHNQQQQQQQQGQRHPRHMRFSRFPQRMAASLPLSMSRHKTEVSSSFFSADCCLLLVACISGKKGSKRPLLF